MKEETLENVFLVNVLSSMFLKGISSNFRVWDPLCDPVARASTRSTLTSSEIGRGCISLRSQVLQKGSIRSKLGIRLPKIQFVMV